MLTSAIGESLPMAIGVALSPAPVAAVIVYEKLHHGDISGRAVLIP
jgi:hypothetical protein